MNRIDRYRGCLLGLAAGDALGTTLEFRRPGTFEPIDDMIGGGPFRLRPGEWTDDTSLALCLAESLIERQGFDPIDHLERYVRWYTEGHLSSTGTCFDIGTTTREALRRFMTSRKPFPGLTSPHSAGNGSFMRLAPVPMFYAGDPERAIELSGESSRTTHALPVAVDACRYFGALNRRCPLGCAERGATQRALHTGRRLLAGSPTLRRDRCRFGRLLPPKKPTGDPGDRLRRAFP